MSEPASSTAGISPAVLVLSLLLAVATTAAIMLALRQSTSGSNGGPSAVQPVSEPTPTEPTQPSDV